jgi:hypothetical protein
LPFDISLSFYRAVYPTFVDSTNGDYRPAPVSPAIDFCDDQITQPSFADLDGNPRGTPHQGSPKLPGGAAWGP